jgi:ribosomal protein L37AE/L43A
MTTPQTPAATTETDDTDYCDCCKSREGSRLIYGDWLCTACESYIGTLLARR